MPRTVLDPAAICVLPLNAERCYRQGLGGVGALTHLEWSGRTGSSSVLAPAATATHLRFHSEALFWSALKDVGLGTG